MTDRALAIAMAFIVPLLLTIAAPYSVSDLAGWIAHGLYFLEHHAILRQDTFSVLPSSPMIYCSWGISVVYALIFKLGGLIAVCGFHALVLALLLSVIYQHSVFRLNRFYSGQARWVTYLVWLAVIPSLTTRPSTIALLPLVLAYLEISEIKDRISVRSALKLIALNVLWVNIHGSFVLLPLMLIWKILIPALERVVKKRTFGMKPSQFTTIILVLVSTWLNPFHFGVFSYVLETLLVSHHRIAEWEATSPWSEPAGFLFFGVMIASLILLWKNRGKERFWELLSSPYFLLLANGLIAVRNSTLPFFVLLPFCTKFQLLTETSPAAPGPLPRKLSNTLKFTIAALLLIILAPGLRERIPFLTPPMAEAFDYTVIPNIVTAIRRTGRDCPVFNDWETGSYLMLQLPNRIFLDARNIIFTDDQLIQYQHATRASPGWQEYLNQYHACFAVLKQPEDRPLIEAMIASSEWKFRLAEKGVALFEHTLPLVGKF